MSAGSPEPARIDGAERVLEALRDSNLGRGNIVVLVVLATWPWIGLFGHEPWKADEAYTFGLVYSYLEGKDWLVPVLADSFFLEKPPIFFWTAAASARLFGGVLSLPEAARLVVPLFLYLTLGFLMATSAILLGRARAWMPPMLLIGALGFFDKVHMLVTDVALLAGISIGLFGLALAPRRPDAAGVALGGGAVVAFMSKGLLGPGVLALTAMAMMARPAGRSPAVIRCLLVAAGIGLPLTLVWPTLLYLKSPDLFMEWFWANNLGRFFGFVRLGHRHDVWFYPVTLMWLSFPIWPLAVLGVTRRIRAREYAEIAMPLVAFVVMAAVLLLSTESRTLYTLPLLLPLALLGATGLDVVPPTASIHLHRVQIVVFAAIVAGLWLGWLGAVIHRPQWFEALIDQRAPDFSMPFAPAFVAVAALGTLFWGWALWGRAATMEATVRAWSVSLTACWLLVLTLWMPLVDYVKSYRSEIIGLQSAMPVGANCVASVHLGEPARAMLHYYAGLITRRLEVDPDAVDCDYLVAQIEPDDRNLAAPSRWRKIWRGTRPGDNKEALELYRRR